MTRPSDPPADDPFKGLPLEDPSWIERAITSHPRLYLAACVLGSTGIALALIRPWDFW